MNYFGQLNRLVPAMHEANYYTKYIFPINGLKLRSMSTHKIGPVTFADGNYINTIISDKKLMQCFKPNTYAIVDVNYLKLEKKYVDGLNSLALKVLKETLGFIYISIYQNNQIYFEKKITISNTTGFEMDDGLVPFLCENKNGNIQLENNKSADLTLNETELITFLDNSNWDVLLNISIEDRTEIQKRIFKALEYLYYVFSDIYSSERMIKFFIILNHVLRKDDNTDLNRKYIASLLNTLFKKVRDIEIYEGNFNSNFEKLYEKMRNNILHGILSFDSEASIVGAADYFILKKIVMELIITLVENKDINKLSSVSELYNYINKIRKAK